MNLMTNSRLQNVFSKLQQSSLNAVAINPGPTLTYLTGMTFHLMERPTVLILSRTGQAAMVFPELEARKLENHRLYLGLFPFGDNPALWTDSFKQACASLHLSSGEIGVEPIRFRFLELDYLTQAMPRAKFVSAAPLFASLRMCKDQDEVALMREAVRIAQKGLCDTIPFIKAGRSEREVAALLTSNMLQAGSDPDLPFAPIVSNGPNGANPHATPSDRLLQKGDLLVIDWGAAYHGYFSDLTRTFAIGEIEPEFRQIHEIVRQANAAGRAASKPGIPAGDVDRAARKVIDAAGYGPYFTHRTGHGLGMEAHEEPYIFAENTFELVPGNTYTVEPGIYLPERGGVRIEDNMLITSDGADTLSDFERSLITLPA
jgi:Xaa-Pro dipeptidase